MQPWIRRQKYIGFGVIGNTDQSDPERPCINRQIQAIPACDPGRTLNDRLGRVANVASFVSVYSLPEAHKSVSITNEHLTLPQPPRSHTHRASTVVHNDKDALGHRQEHAGAHRQGTFSNQPSSFLLSSAHKCTCALHRSLLSQAATPVLGRNSYASSQSMAQRSTWPLVPSLVPPLPSRSSPTSTPRSSRKAALSSFSLTCLALQAAKPLHAPSCRRRTAWTSSVRFTLHTSLHSH